MLHHTHYESHALLAWTAQPWALMTDMFWLLPVGQFSDSDGTTIFVKGFDKYLGEEAVRQQLTETFADCGTVSTVRLPTDRETGELKGIGFIEFATAEAKVSPTAGS